MITVEQFLVVCGFGAFWGAFVVVTAFFIAKFIVMIVSAVIDLLRIRVLLWKEN